jgi:hypothetical protein
MSRALARPRSQTIPRFHRLKAYLRIMGEIRCGCRATGYKCAVNLDVIWRDRYKRRQLIMPAPRREP